MSTNIFFKDQKVISIGLIHDSRHVGFHIVMQIRHVLCGKGGGGGGANIEKKSKMRKIGSTKLQKVNFSI